MTTGYCCPDCTNGVASRAGGRCTECQPAHDRSIIGRTILPILRGQPLRPVVPTRGQERQA